MNCCDDFGNCNQGRDCPVRKEMAELNKDKPYVSWISDAGLGLLICMASAAGVISTLVYLYNRFA
jgi:hypothetical protein